MPEPILKREFFETDRTMEFFSEKELQMQIGTERQNWPQAILKELIDNSLDACESAGISPEISITVEDNSLTVADNGPGIPATVLEKSLDYMVRVSDKNHYISPSRGQLGNALKCIWAVPFVMDGEKGRVDVYTNGRKHEIAVIVDRIAQIPRIEHVISAGFVKNGTFVKIYLDEIASLISEESHGFYNSQELIANYAAMNPHAIFSYSNLKSGVGRFHPRRGTFNKWTPNLPTSSYWYSIEKLRSLIAAYVNLESNGGKSKTVRQFVSEFSGLTSSVKQKKVVDATGLSRAYLKDLVVDNDIASEPVETLLDAMNEHSRPVKPIKLGVIGEEYIKRWLRSRFVDKNSIKYKKICGEAEGLPYVIEIAFGVYRESYQEKDRLVTVGLNWAPTLKVPIDNLFYLMGENRIDAFDPVALFFHIACPRFEFTDRGKSRLDLPDGIRDSLERCIRIIAKPWKAAKRRADRENRVQQRELDDLRLRRLKDEKITVKDAAYQVMEAAYLKASDNGRLPANARQIMYAARDQIIELTGKPKPWKNSSYFTQTLLTDYLKDFPDKTKEWDIVWDARGKLTEPHTGHRVELGGLGVRRYINSWNDHISANSYPSFDYSLATKGPANRYENVLFIEKEGFNELLRAAKIAKRFDIAFMSTKGMSVTAARRLVEALTEKNVNIFVLHDFDKAGFSIVHTLRSDTRRWKFKTTPNVIDLGLRLDDVEHLKSESVIYNSKVDPRYNLIKSGATEEEANFLVQGGRPENWQGKRVELNAMTSKQFIDWLEGRLQKAGVRKFVPGQDTLEKAYRRAHRTRFINKAIRKAMADYDPEAVGVPEGLESKIRKSIEGSATAWDNAIKRFLP